MPDVLTSLAQAAIQRESIPVDVSTRIALGTKSRWRPTVAALTASLITFAAMLWALNWLRGRGLGGRLTPSRSLFSLDPVEGANAAGAVGPHRSTSSVANALPRDRPLTSRQLGASKDKYEWVNVAKKASWSARYAHTAVLTTTQQMFVIGGAAAQGSLQYLNDVWLSVDSGATWSYVKARSDRFGPRRGHATVLSTKQVIIFVLGGFCGKDCFMNDWWSSENGAVWNKMGEAPWSGRHGHAAAMTSDDMLVIMGGHDGHSYLNDVWAIQDPAQALVYSVWKLQLGKAAWHARYGHAVVTNSRDVILLMGGSYVDKVAGQIECFNDVWRSDDSGATWAVVTRSAPWEGRYQHVAQINGQDQIFIVGGLGAGLDRFNDVWRSVDDGATWDAVTPVAPWAARYEHAAVMDVNGSIFVLGGVSTGDESFNDVWRSERTCMDDVECPESQTCRDGTFENFKGQPNPLCVDRCDRRIFDKCDIKEACQLKDVGPTCVDPCDSKSCKDGYVCEVHPRHNDALESVAEAYCLACSNAKTKFACDKLRQCDWSGDAEVCQMKCRVVTVADKCEGVDYCKWDGGKDKCVTS